MEIAAIDFDAGPKYTANCCPYGMFEIALNFNDAVGPPKFQYSFKNRNVVHSSPSGHEYEDQWNHFEIFYRKDIILNKRKRTCQLQPKS